MLCRRAMWGRIFPVTILLLMAPTSASATPLVSVQPIIIITIPESGAIFTCTSGSAMVTDVVEWLINGTSLDSLQLNNVNEMDGISLLFTSITLEYNNTVIQCRANTTTRGVVTSGNATLLVQGLLSAVESLNVIKRESDLNLRWTAPFTLNTHDISYCVDVVSSTSSATLHSECGITVTEFTHPLPPRSWCDVYNFTVTPVNGVGNGTRASVEYSGAMSSPRLQRVRMYTLTMSAPVCNTEVTFVDIDTEETITLEDTDLTIAETNITFAAQQLIQNRHYNVTVTASNVAGSATSQDMISTHDITRCFFSHGVGIVEVSASFTLSSNATGALVNLIFINETERSVDFSRSHHQTFNVTHGLKFSVEMFYPGRYMMLLYDIEENGKLQNGITYPACGDNVIINGERNSSEPSNLCCITSLAGLITVTCPFPRYQVTAQISDADRVGILHINTTTETQTPVTVQVMESGEYLVTVFPIQDGVGILSGLHFSQIHMVDDLTTTQGTNSMPTLPATGTLMQQTSTTLSITLEPTVENISFTIVIVMGAGLVILTLLSTVLGVVVIIQCYTARHNRKMEAVSVELEQLGGKEGAKNHDIAQLYKEIGDEGAAHTTRPAVPSRVAAPGPEYEDVLPAGDTPKSSQPYNITLCSAYGVSLDNKNK